MLTFRANQTRRLNIICSFSLNSSLFSQQKGPFFANIYAVSLVNYSNRPYHCYNRFSRNGHNFQPSFLFSTNSDNLNNSDNSNSSNGRETERKKIVKRSKKKGDKRKLEFGEIQKKLSEARFFTWRTSIISLLIMFVVVLYYQQYGLRKQYSQKKGVEQSSYGQTNIGQGTWDMVNHHGEPVNQDTFRGKYQLVYFGFTFCPDVCPRELTKMAHALNILEKRGFVNDIVPIFVSVDPKRDSPQLVSRFIRQFHPNIVGLTGTSEQVSHFARAYKAYFSTPGLNESQDDYIVDHVTMMYLMGRQGEYLGHISTLDNSQEMADKIANLMRDVNSPNSFLDKFFKQKN